MAPNGKSTTKTAPAPAAANGNGAAPAGKGKGKKDVALATAPAPAPAALPPAEKDDAAKDAAGGASKPDQAAYHAEQEKIKAEIDVLQTKLNAVRDKIALTSKDGPAADRRAALRAEQDSIRGQQSNTKASRGKIHDQIKSIQDNVQKKVAELNAAKGKAPFKTVAEVDTAIRNLEKQVESGSMAIAQEKRALVEISNYKRARKAIENFQSDQEFIEKERAKIDALKKELDDPEAKAVSDRYDAIRKELDEIKKESDEAFAGRNKLFDERNDLQKQLNGLHEKKRESTQRYRDAHDRYWQKVNEDRARRAERYRAQRAAEEEEKRKEIIDRLREEASVPAYESQIEDCQTLVDYFTKLLSGGAAAAAAAVPAAVADKKEVAGVAKLEIRKVEQPTDQGLVARKKKGDDEDNYFVAAKGKGKKGGKAAPAPAPAVDGAAAAPSKDKFQVPLATLTALLSMSIPPPTANAEVPRVIEDLKTKKTWFEANQKRVTAENVAKAEEKIHALESKNTTSKASPETNGHADPDAVADAPSPVDGTTEATPSEAPASEAVVAESS